MKKYGPDGRTECICLDKNCNPGWNISGTVIRACETSIKEGTRKTFEAIKKIANEVNKTKGAKQGRD